jgi:hypothetical protein
MSDDTYNSLDFRINTLYDFIYSKKGCYIYQPIIKKNIKLIDLKMPDVQYDKIFTDDITFIKYYNERYHFKRTSDSTYPCTISIGFYPNKNVDNLENLYNIGLSYILSECVTQQFNGILLPIMYFDMTFEQIKKYKVIFEQIKDKITKNDIINVFISEHFFKLRTLEEYITENRDNLKETDYKIIIFHILYSLYEIRSKLTNFRHNKLNLDAIRLYIKPKTEELQMYKVKETTFIVPNGGFNMKISDFDYSFTDDYINNIRTTKNHNNNYYDIHYFLNCLYLKLKPNIPDCLVSLFDKYLPQKYRYDKDNFEGLDETIYENEFENESVENILKTNELFNDFIKGKDEKLGGTNLTISKNKNSHLYYNKVMFIGTRKLIVPKFKTTTNVFEKANNKISDSEDDINGRINKIDLVSSSEHQGGQAHLMSEFDRVSKMNKHVSGYGRKQIKRNEEEKEEDNDDDVSSSEKKEQKRERYKKDDSSSEKKEKNDVSSDKSSEDDKEIKLTPELEELSKKMNRLIKKGKKDKKSKKDKKISRTKKDDDSSSSENGNVPTHVKKMLDNLPEGYVGELPIDVSNLMNTTQGNGTPPINPMSNFLLQPTGMEALPGMMQPPTMQPNMINPMAQQPLMQPAIASPMMQPEMVNPMMQPNMVNPMMQQPMQGMQPTIALGGKKHLPPFSEYRKNFF